MRLVMLIEQLKGFVQGFAEIMFPPERDRARIVVTLAVQKRPAKMCDPRLLSELWRSGRQCYRQLKIKAHTSELAFVNDFDPVCNFFGVNVDSHILRRLAGRSCKENRPLVLCLTGGKG